MNRRTFLGRLVAVLGAAVCVKLKVAPHTVGSFGAPPTVNEGISIRFIRGFDIAKFDKPTRLDAFIVQPQLEPVLMCTCADWLTCEHPWPALLPPGSGGITGMAPLNPGEMSVRIRPAAITVREWSA